MGRGGSCKGAVCHANVVAWSIPRELPGGLWGRGKALQWLAAALAPKALPGKPLARGAEGGAARTAVWVGSTLLLCLGFGKSQNPQRRRLKVKETAIDPKRFFTHG